MSAKSVQAGWPVKAVDPPKVSSAEWGWAAVPGIILAVMAVLQIVSFADFRDLLDEMGLPGPTAWAVCAIVAELWGAVGFFKLRLSASFRLVSYTMAVLAAGFWFILNLQLVSNGMAAELDNSGFFGRFLAQQPGWWTVLEVTLLLWLVVYNVGLLRDSRLTARTAR